MTDSSISSSISGGTPLVPQGDDLVQRYGSYLRRAVYRALRAAGVRLHRGEPEPVDELMQEVYCRIFAAEGRCLQQCRAGSTGQVAAFLARVAERVVFDHLRRGAAEKRGRALLADWDEPEGTALRPVAVDPAASPEERLLGEERRRQLFDRFARNGHLPARPHWERDLRILHLALVEGWSSPEISERFGGRLAPSSVDSLIHRLRRRLAAGGVQLPRRAPRRSSEAGKPPAGAV